MNAQRVRGVVRVVSALATVASIGIVQASWAMAGGSGAAKPAPLDRAVNTLGFAVEDVATLASGRATARQLETMDESELGAVGVVLLAAPVDSVVDSFRDLSILRRSGMAECAGRFSADPTIDDLACLDVPSGDLEQLPKARVGDSDVKLSDVEIGRFGRNLADDSDVEFKKALMRRVVSWQQNGIAGLANYADKKRRVMQSDVTSDLVKTLETERPDGLEPVESFQYWAVERFGSFKPMVDVNNMSVLRGAGMVRLETVQLYASHYCNGVVTSVDLMPVSTETGPQTLMRLSFRVRMDSLGGMFGGFKRHVGRGKIVDQVAAGLELVRHAVAES